MTTRSFPTHTGVGGIARLASLAIAAVALGSLLGVPNHDSGARVVARTHRAAGVQRSGALGNVPQVTVSVPSHARIMSVPSSFLGLSTEYWQRYEPHAKAGSSRRSAWRGLDLQDHEPWPRARSRRMNTPTEGGAEMNDKPTNTTIVSIDDDRGLGLALFLVFIVACLLVIDAVALLALVPAWWVLGFAFGVHALMTGAVLLAVFNALSGGALGLGGGVYDPAEPDDGYRVPADRMWPRGVSRERTLTIGRAICRRATNYAAGSITFPSGFRGSCSVRRLGQCSLDGQCYWS
jgi:hypothetical protein